ncbi:hypothetical protein TNCV_2509651 [Trichonephila clavipes]|nr:hypothetical protein TNCV_2509651 [Trichonephila clavipes]
MILLRSSLERVKTSSEVLSWNSVGPCLKAPLKKLCEIFLLIICFVTSSIVVNPHLSISVMVSPAGQGHVRRHRLSLYFYDPPAVE